MKHIATLLLIGFAWLAQAQSDSALISFVHLKNGEVFAATLIQPTEKGYIIQDINVGQVEIGKKEVSKIEHLEPGQLVRIELVDNTIYRGRLLGVSDEAYELDIERNGTQKFQRFSVSRLEPIHDRQAIDNPNRTRYFFAPSAIPLNKGEGYYQNAYLLANSANFGITDRFVLGGGIVLPLFFYVTPKYSIKISDRLYAAAGGIGGMSILPGAFLAGGLPFGVITYGSADNNITIGSGYGFIYSENEWEQTTYPIGVVNGMVRLSSRLSLVSENWIIPVRQNREREVWIDEPPTPPYLEYEEYEVETTVLALSAGLRILAGEKATFDIAPVYIYTGEDGLAVPYLDFTYRF